MALSRLKARRTKAVNTLRFGVPTNITSTEFLTLKHLLGGKPESKFPLLFGTNAHTAHSRVLSVSTRFKAKSRVELMGRFIKHLCGPHRKAYIRMLPSPACMKLLRSQS